MEVKYSGHSVYRTEYHIVWVTKYRRKALNSGFAKYTDTVLRDIAKNIEAVEVVELNVQPEHVHVVLVIPPRYAVSKVIEIMKSRSAKAVREKFDWLDNVYYGTKSLWSVGYFVSTIGLDEKMIKNYVKHQQNQNSGQAKLEF